MAPLEPCQVFGPRRAHQSSLPTATNSVQSAIVVTLRYVEQSGSRSHLRLRQRHLLPVSSQCERHSIDHRWETWRHLQRNTRLGVRRYRHSSNNKFGNECSPTICMQRKCWVRTMPSGSLVMGPTWRSHHSTILWSKILTTRCTANRVLCRINIPKPSPFATQRFVRKHRHL